MLLALVAGSWFRLKATSHWQTAVDVCADEGNSGRSANRGYRNNYSSGVQWCCTKTYCVYGFNEHYMVAWGWSTVLIQWNLWTTDEENWTSRFKSSDYVNNKVLLLVVSSVKLAEGTRINRSLLCFCSGEVVQIQEEKDLYQISAIFN